MNAKIFIVLFVVVACAFAFDYSSEPSEIICLESINVGRCRAAMRRYGYDSKTKKCIEFEYGGCGGNLNNFLTLEDCMKTCKTQA